MLEDLLGVVTQGDGELLEVGSRVVDHLALHVGHRCVSVRAEVGEVQGEKVVHEEAQADVIEPRGQLVEEFFRLLVLRDLDDEETTIGLLGEKRVEMVRREEVVHAVANGELRGVFFFDPRFSLRDHAL